jgi:hypothetical protein
VVGSAAPPDLCPACGGGAAGCWPIVGGRGGGTATPWIIVPPGVGDGGIYPLPLQNHFVSTEDQCSAFHLRISALGTEWRRAESMHSVFCCIQ